MKPTEIRPLVIAARKAFDRQSKAGLIDDGETFDAWRHKQCMAAVVKPGITACNHGDFQLLLAHFQTLAGDDAAALRSLLKSSKPTDQSAPGDSHEVRRKVANEIAQRLAEHTWLAETSLEMIIAQGEAEWDRQNRGVPYPGPNPDWLRKIRDRKLSIEARGKGPITVGYIVYLLRARSTSFLQRPSTDHAARFPSPEFFSKWRPTVRICRFFSDCPVGGQISTNP